ncbi:MAG: extracellular solute-binding protein [Candidatus Hermodarchaeota archaeon]
MPIRISYIFVFLFLFVVFGVGSLTPLINRLSYGGQEVITLQMIYGSEKRGWIEDVTNDFLEYWAAQHPDTRLEVNFLPMGSRSSLIALVNGVLKPTIWSPASSLWVPLANGLWNEKYGSNIINESTPLVYSPIVIGTWQSYLAKHNITGFNDLHELAISPQSDLLFAHTDPQESNSGFMACLLEVTVASGKSNASDLTYSDLIAERTKQWMTELEAKAVYYGSSTGFLMEQAVGRGPGSFNAFVVYENLVLEKNYGGEPGNRWNDKLVAIYPSEGTLKSDHPFCILDAPWVSSAQKMAAQELKNFLLREDIQSKAMIYGLRPIISSVPLDYSRFSETYGLQANYSSPILVPPSEENVDSEKSVLRRLPDLWLATRP